MDPPPPDLLVRTVAEALPEATVRGTAAGLHATVELAEDDDEHAVLEAARQRRIDLTTMRDFWIEPGAGPPTLLLGYVQLPAPAIPAASGSWPTSCDRHGDGDPTGSRHATAR